MMLHLAHGAEGEGALGTAGKVPALRSCAWGNNLAIAGLGVPEQDENCGTMVGLLGNVTRAFSGHCHCHKHKELP